jgi:hypothetical protein
LKLVLIAVDHSETLADIRQSDAARHRLIQAVEYESHSIVFDLDDGAAVFAMAANRNHARPDLPGEAVLDRVLDERLQDHARHDDIERVRADLLADAKLGPEANDLDVEVLVDRLQLFTQRDEVLMTAKQPPQQG